MAIPKYLLRFLESLTVVVIESVPDEFITFDVKLAELYVTPSTGVLYDFMVEL